MPSNVVDSSLHSLAAYDYSLPKELIAQHPTDRRDAARLMVIDRKTGTITHGSFRDFESFLGRDDQLILNNTKVIRARLRGTRPTGGSAEVFLSKPLGGNRWEVMAKPLRKLSPGTEIVFGPDFSCVVVEKRPEQLLEVAFSFKDSFSDSLDRYGDIPLPPYIERETEKGFDVDRYQTVYAETPGAVAAPTAGLHLTDDMLSSFRQKGVEINKVTLHVGIGTFRAVEVDDIRKHTMHKEWMQLTGETAERINASKGRCVCVGTTAMRTIESASDSSGIVHPCEKETDLFIYPGVPIKKVDALLTNFHLPGSTLLMLISAFAGYDLVREAYQMAIEERYRFFSYGDAMLLV